MICKTYTFKGVHGNAIGAAVTFAWLAAAAASKYVSLYELEMRKEWFSEYKVWVTLKFCKSTNPEELHKLLAKVAGEAAELSGATYLL